MDPVRRGRPGEQLPADLRAPWIVVRKRENDGAVAVEHVLDGRGDGSRLLAGLVGFERGRMKRERQQRRFELAERQRAGERAAIEQVEAQDRFEPGRAHHVHTPRLLAELTDALGVLRRGHEMQVRELGDAVPHRVV